MEFEERPSLSPQSSFLPASSSDFISRPRTDLVRRRARSRSLRPSSPPDSHNRSQASRSKTGCITCRRRKKKCDEAKPGCNNCHKNNIECEGYSEKTVWRSSGQSCACRTAEKFPLDIALSSLPSIHPGLDGAADLNVLSHFYQKLSWKLALPSTCSNQFLDLIMPLAFKHDGLMHGILALSASHLYNTQSQRSYSVLKQQHEHLCAALRCLQEDVSVTEVQDPTMALIMIMYLLSKTEGDTTGIYRFHFSTFRRLLNGSPECHSGYWKRGDPQVAEFLIEFYRYHEIHTSYVTSDTTACRGISLRSSISSTGEYTGVETSDKLTSSPRASATIGVLDGLDQLIIQTQSLRARIRSRIQLQLMPPVDLEMKEIGLVLEQQIRDWNSGQETETVRWYLSEVYRHACWADLFRIMHVECREENYPLGGAPASPAPLSPRQRLAQRRKLTSTIDEALELARHLPADCPSQSFLLAPIFKLGCSSLEGTQRQKINEYLSSIGQYTGMGNVPLTCELLEKIWHLNDQGGSDGIGVDAWNVEEIMAGMNYDFLIV